MERRTFLKRSLLMMAGAALGTGSDLLASGNSMAVAKAGRMKSSDLYKLFCNPDSIYHPFVRWWWNGDKVQADEIRRELRLLKAAGIGGVEINPVKFPRTDDMGIESLPWLSDEWIDMLQVAFDEAKSLDMTCDLIVGSGWPFGGEFLKGNERAEVVANYSEKLLGPIDYEITDDGLFCAADPKISSPYLGKKIELMSLTLVPEPFSSIDEVIDLKPKGVNGVYKFKVPKGKYVLFAVIKIDGFLQVINGAPGATGPVLNHFNKAAVKKYLNNMSDKIQNKLGPLSDNIRALFTDSMELEGANWTSDMAEEFKRKRGYDILPYLPYIMFEAGSMGNALSYTPRVEMSPEMNDKIQRMRYDFEYTKAEMLDERFTHTYIDWCKGLKVKSRAQAYGRGLFPLESSLDYDIPEAESWTMTWLRHKLGVEMSEEDYRRGRCYTMVNKYVSSAAHLRGKRLISCEEMTNTYTVFNMTLELLKIGGDQTAISGITHSIFHGFNYSPKNAPFPGWIRYGAYYNENNTFWPYFHYYTAYKGRLSSALQHASMFADIAILNPIADMWTTMGMQNEPFPTDTYAKYKTLIWEAINKTGGGCDYVSESIIQGSEIKDGKMCYGPRKFSTLILIAVERVDTTTMRKLYDFVSNGGRIFCVETYPHISEGYLNYASRDKEVADILEKMKQFTDRFILLHKPEKDYIDWYSGVQKKYGISKYLTIEKPNMFLMQNRYQTDDNAEMFFISYAHRYDSHKTRITFSNEIVKGRNAWVWNLENGERNRLSLDNNNSHEFDFGPADSLLIVFDKQKGGSEWTTLPTTGSNVTDISNDWDVTFKHCREKEVKTAHFDTLKDLKDTDFVNFSGTAIYKKKINIDAPENIYINLGLVLGISEVFVNGKSLGVKWYGRRIHLLGDDLVKGENEIEIHVVTVMGNYMKSLTDNKVAQMWMKRQDIESMGLIGPIKIYKSK